MTEGDKSGIILPQEVRFRLRDRQIIAANHLPLTSFFLNLGIISEADFVFRGFLTSELPRLLGQKISRPTVIFTDGEVRYDTQDSSGVSVGIALSDAQYVAWKGLKKVKEDDPSDFYFQTVLKMKELQKHTRGTNVIIQSVGYREVEIRFGKKQRSKGQGREE